MSKTKTKWIADKAVTYAKIQDVSATSRILGRKTAGAGSVEELTASDIASLLISEGSLAASARTITAGAGLTGGGDLSANRTLDIGEGTGITVSADAISTNDSEIVHDNLSGFVSNEHIDHSSVSISAGEGLTGGGDLTSTRSLSLNIPGLSEKLTLSATDELVVHDGSNHKRLDFSVLNTAIYDVGLSKLDTNVNNILELAIGVALDDTDVTVTSDGATVSLNLEKSGGGDVRYYFTDGVYTLDCTPAASVALTAGSDTSPTLNYVYILQSTKALTVSTTGFPAVEYAPVATVVVQSAASVQTEGAYKIHAWTDHTSNHIGHLSHINYWIRQQNATWIEGTLLTPSVGDGVFDISVSSGNVLQLHPHVFPAINTATGDVLYIINDSVTTYDKVTDLTGLTLDANGDALSNVYNLVIWGIINESVADCKILVNLPTGSYLNDSGGRATNDDDNTAVYDIPAMYKGTGFLISRLTVQKSGTTFSILQNEDLRGLFPSTAAGGGPIGQVEFADNVFKIFDESDNTKEAAFQVSGLTTGTTRTLSIPDENGTIALDNKTITAGAGLTGGGDISANRTINVGEGTGITVSADSISTNDSEIVHQNLSGAGSNTHAQIDTHIGTSNIHFTEGSIDHGSIAGLGDDDHSQYALLAGRSGGQTLIGGTAASDDLTLSSTSNGTKGKILFGTASAYDEVNDRFGIGTTSPANPIEINRDSASAVTFISAENAGAGASYITSKSAGNAFVATDSGAAKFSGLSIRQSGATKWLVVNNASDALQIGDLTTTPSVYIAADRSRTGIGYTSTTAMALNAYSTGNVEIGVASTPGARLHVKGSGATSATYSLKVDNSSSTALLYVRDDGLVTTPGSMNIGSSYSANAAADDLILANSGATGITLASDTQPQIRFDDLSAATSRAYIYWEEGADALRLEVPGSSSSIQLRTNNGTSTVLEARSDGNCAVGGDLILNGGTGQPTSFCDISSASTASRLCIQPEAGNAGMYCFLLPSGTDQNAAIQVSNNSDPDNRGRLSISIAGTFASISTNTLGTGTAPTLLGFGVNSSNHMLINPSGYVGINESSQSARLHIKSTGTTSSTYALKTDDSSSNALLYVRDDGLIETNASSILEIPTIRGGDGSGENLTLLSTSHATKGNIILNNGLYVGPSSMSYTPSTGGNTTIRRSDNTASAHKVINDGQYNAIQWINYNGTENWKGSLLITQRARGSEASPAAVQDGDLIFAFSCRPHDGTSFSSVDTAIIRFLAGSNHTTSSHETYITFSTTAAGDTGSTEALRLNGDSSARFAETIYIDERSAALGDNAGQGQFWVKNDTPNSPYFTDDAGNDKHLFYNEYAKYSYQVSSGTAGGTNAAATWTTCALNTTDTEHVLNTNISRSSNAVTLKTGKYHIHATCTVYRTDRAKLRLRQTSGTPATVLVGENCFGASNYGGNEVLPLDGYVTVTGTSATFELQYYTQSSFATYGLGLDTSSGENEVYRTIEIRKIEE